MNVFPLYSSYVKKKLSYFYNNVLPWICKKNVTARWKELLFYLVNIIFTSLLKFTLENFAQNICLKFGKLLGAKKGLTDENINDVQNEYRVINA